MGAEEEYRMLESGGLPRQPFNGNMDFALTEMGLGDFPSRVAPGLRAERRCRKVDAAVALCSDVVTAKALEMSLRGTF